MDTDELFFNNEIDCTFIEPYPQLLLSLLKASDLERVEIISSNLQDVSVEKFADLEAYIYYVPFCSSITHSK